MYQLSLRSLSRLKGVHTDLVLVVSRAIQLSKYDFGVLEGLRSEERQRKLYNSGKSQTMKSKHLVGLAVDLVAYDENGHVTWDMHYYRKINMSMQQAAEELGVSITWGGSWISFQDGPHWQLEIGK